MCLAGGLALTSLITLATAGRSRPRLQTTIAVVLLLAMVGFIVAKLAGHSIFRVDPFHDPRYASFLSGLLLLTAIGLARGWLVARWMALTLSGAGIVSAGLNLVP